MNILHLSDLHITANDAKNTNIYARLDFMRNSDLRDFPVIVTGDLIDNEGNVGDLSSAGIKVDVPINKNDPGVRAIIEGGIVATGLLGLTSAVGLANVLTSTQLNGKIASQALVRAYNKLRLLGAGKYTYICPGNHDLGLWGNFHDAQYRPLFDQFLFNPLNSTHPSHKWTLAPPADLLNRLGLSRTAGYSSVKRTMFYPLTDGIVNVSLVGLDTTVDPGNVPTPLTAGRLATGEVVAWQVGEVIGFLGASNVPGFQNQYFGQQRPHFRILFFHHHPWDRNSMHVLRGAEQLLSALEQYYNQIQDGYDLILFGHMHGNPEQWTGRLNSSTAPSLKRTNVTKFGALKNGTSRQDNDAFQIELNANSVPRITRVKII